MKPIFSMDDVLQKILESEDWAGFLRGYDGLEEARAELAVQIDGELDLEDAANTCLALQTAAALAYGVEVGLALARGALNG